MDFPQAENCRRVSCLDKIRNYAGSPCHNRCLHELIHFLRQNQAFKRWSRIRPHCAPLECRVSNPWSQRLFWNWHHYLQWQRAIHLAWSRTKIFFLLHFLRFPQDKRGSKRKARVSLFPHKQRKKLRHLNQWGYWHRKRYDTCKMHDWREPGRPRDVGRWHWCATARLDNTYRHCLNTRPDSSL